MQHSLTRKVCCALAAVVLLVATRDAQANLITNGDFSSNGGSGQLGATTTLTDWTGGGQEGAYGGNVPPVFVFAPGTTTQLQTTGSTGDAFMGTIRFWSATNAPDNGVIVAADGDSTFAGTLSQTVSGLTVGHTYTLSFNWAGAQQTSYDGPTTEQWGVTFGGSTQNTSIVDVPNHGFSGWQAASMTFTATSTSQMLTFAAIGTPNGAPPWLLLDGVSLTDTTAVPEPSSLLILGIGTVGVLGVGLRRRFKTAQV